MPIELTAAKCPCCGANLLLNEQMESGFCQYCGSKIIVQAAIAFNKVMVEGTVKTKADDFSIKAGVLESYNGEDVEISIPSNVISVGSNAFANCFCLRSIVIPESVTSIGNYAFNGCSGLTSITIPKSVTSIGCCAFLGCSGLTSITIPDSVTNIGSSAFLGCSGLTSITIPESVTSIGNDVFARCSGLTSITIPKSVTVIGDYAFKGCSGLTSITIPKSVSYIGRSAFEGCSGLTSITISESLIKIIEKHVDVFYKSNNIEKCIIIRERDGVEQSVDLNNPIDLDNYYKLLHYIPKCSDHYKTVEKWKKYGDCQHCGGNIRFGKCRNCGAKKDY